ncbi:hypothetical protein G7Z17_g10376 [Cylindrodendrum hubeiense]|uniref:Uncharacterized protein n=1 Tax=Cylindrodendrum hubeiense TaxID=595255 RepID=A0A9P5L7B3_9HYPO|nr:hypothetical protein G7Z17_g10376 [Cylindrodendrum hubeiense]
MKASTFLVFPFFSGVFALHARNSSTSSDGPVDPSIAQCDDKWLDDASSPNLRWAAAGAKTAWDQVLTEWWPEQANPDRKLSFSQFVANHFNAKDLMRCQNMGDGPCGDTMNCDDVNEPAGFLILNSFVAIHGNKIPEFQSTFAPIKPESNSWLKNLISVANLIAGLSYAYTWNIPFKAAKIFQGNNYHGVAKDSASAAITFGMSMWRNSIPSPESIKDDVTSMMGAVFEGWINSELDYLKELFSGSDEAIVTLTMLLKDGLTLELANEGDIDLGEFVTVAEKIVYSQLIPSIWTQTRPDDKSAHPWAVVPMILMGKGDCATRAHLLRRVPTWEDKTASSDWPDDYYNPKVGKLKLNPLPGGDGTELDGKKWGGVTLNDMVISAYEGFRLNDFKNGYEVDLSDANSYDLMRNGIQTPGIIKIPLCTEEGLAQGALEELMPRGTNDVLPCKNYVLTEKDKEDWAYNRYPTVLEGIDG